VQEFYVEPKYSPTGIKPYQGLINTVFYATKAIENGDIATLKNLKS
jgi:hypothetical protein